MSNKVYETVTENIINLLEKGEIPWQKPWATNGQGAPTNLESGKTYRGINFWNTALISMDRGYSSKYFASFKQVSDLGGKVRKGEKGIPIVFFKMLEKENSQGETDEIPLARYSTVFNIEQCDGLDSIKEIEKKNSGAKVFEFTPIERAETVSQNYFGTGPEHDPLIRKLTLDLRHGGNKAFYSPSCDYIQMPEKTSFRKSEEYYSTLFHEIVHSTGHEKRLNRTELKSIAGFGSHEYSKEELVAELGSAYLCSHAGISMPVIENQAAYIGHWLKKLRDDRKLLVSAASKAMAATDFVLGVK